MIPITTAKAAVIKYKVIVVIKLLYHSFDKNILTNQKHMDMKNPQNVSQELCLLKIEFINTDAKNTSATPRVTSAKASGFANIFLNIHSLYKKRDEIYLKVF